LERAPPPPPLPTGTFEICMTLTAAGIALLCVLDLEVLGVKGRYLSSRHLVGAEEIARRAGGETWGGQRYGCLCGAVFFVCGDLFADCHTEEDLGNPE